MLYLLAILVPPLAMLMSGRVIQAVACLVLVCTVIGWPLAAIWALFVVSNRHADRRHRELLKAQQQRPPVNIYQR
jgi:uncharacterized membrane protein YqaE (UPF0057 family)